MLRELLSRQGGPCSSLTGARQVVLGLTPAVAGKRKAMAAVPAGITTCLFDLDGVLTQTAKIHAQAWKEMFDDFLRDWADRHGLPFEAFDRPTDYDEYVDGKPRLDGVHSFLVSRGIELPMGSPAD